MHNKKHWTMSEWKMTRNLVGLVCVRTGVVAAAPGRCVHSESPFSPLGTMALRQLLLGIYLDVTWKKFPKWKLWVQILTPLLL